MSFFVCARQELVLLVLYANIDIYRSVYEILMMTVTVKDNYEVQMDTLLT